MIGLKETGLKKTEDHYLNMDIKIVIQIYIYLRVIGPSSAIIIYYGISMAPPLARSVRGSKSVPELKSFKMKRLDFSLERPTYLI